MKQGLNLQTIEGNLTTLWQKLAIGRSATKNQGLCMQGTIIVVVFLIIGLVLGSYITAGLSKKFE
jgi:hypothetical protein